MGLFSKNNRHIDTLVADLPDSDRKEVLRLIKGLRFTKYLIDPKIDVKKKQEVYGKRLNYILDLTQKINAIMKKNGKKPLFSNAHDYNVLGRDYVNLMKESNQSW
ncbi:MAG: hypothetical protein J5822_00195 [Eubacteriaceae bacterium]|nr:hypothetical protein [Eubacteriaceae bacterium]